jgi:hypothetical protein
MKELIQTRICMKKAKSTDKTSNNTRSWNKEDYYEYMDVALDAHSAEKHASVRQNTQSHIASDAETVEHHVTPLTATLRSFAWHAPASAHKPRAAHAGKIRL